MSAAKLNRRQHCSITVQGVDTDLCPSRTLQSQTFRELSGHEPRYDVVTAAGWKGNDEADGPGRIGVGCEARARSKGAQKDTNVKR